MRYYFRENIRRYEKMIRMGLADWAEWSYGGIDLHDFSSREFLELALTKLSFNTLSPAALELGTGVGPGAVYLAERGFQVTGYDLIPEAIHAAKELAKTRDLSIRYKVMDVTQIPHTGSQFDLIVDSYCINHIVFDEDRRKVFESVKARLKSAGFYLISSSVYDPSRHSPERKVVDRGSGKVYDVYDGNCLYDPETDYYYEPFESCPSERERTESCGDAFAVNGSTYIPKRCYRDAKGLVSELETQGFNVLLQNGELGEDVICVHSDSEIRLTEPLYEREAEA